MPSPVCSLHFPASQQTSQWEHSSISASVTSLFNLSTTLTARDAWAGDLAGGETLISPPSLAVSPFKVFLGVSDAELLLAAPRADTPLHLPEAPPPAKPWAPPPNMTTAERRRLAGLEQQDEGSEPRPQHCSARETTCAGLGRVTVKQRRQMATLAALTK